MTRRQHSRDLLITSCCEHITASTVCHRGMYSAGTISISNGTYSTVSIPKKLAVWLKGWCQVKEKFKKTYGECNNMHERRGWLWFFGNFGKKINGTNSIKNINKLISRKKFNILGSITNNMCESWELVKHSFFWLFSCFGQIRKMCSTVSIHQQAAMIASSSRFVMNQSVQSLGFCFKLVVLFLANGCENKLLSQQLY